MAPSIGVIVIVALAGAVFLLLLWAGGRSESKKDPEVEVHDEYAEPDVHDDYGGF